MYLSIISSNRPKSQLSFHYAMKIHMCFKIGDWKLYLSYHPRACTTGRKPISSMNDVLDQRKIISTPCLRKAPKRPNGSLDI